MFKRISLLLIVFILFISLPLIAVATSETKELFTLDRPYNMAVSILFDREMPVVSFIAPDSSVIESTTLRYDSGDDWVQFYIPNAMAGTWKITYDKKSNTLFEINYSSYMNPIAIDEFAFESMDNNRISTHFIVDGEADNSYQWRIFAVICKNGSVVGEKMLAEGSASLGKEVACDVYIGDLADYANYRLRLDVWQRDGVEEVYDSRMADGTFSVIGNTTDPAIEDFRTELNITDGNLLVDWEEWSIYTEYIVAVFNYDVSKTEPFYFTEITDGRTWFEALFDPAAASIQIEITGRKDGKNSLTKSKTIKIDNGVRLTAQTSGLTNASQVRIDYEVPQNMSVDIVVNGKTDTVNLNGTGSFSVKMPDSYNEVEMRYSLTDKNVIYVVKFDVTVDSTPPILRLPENKAAIRVDKDEYVLAGVTEPGAVLQVGAETVNVQPDGTFLHTIALSKGENIIKVKAIDGAGNVTAHDVIIIRVNNTDSASDSESGEGGFWNKLKNYIPLIGSFLVSIILVCIVLLFSREFARTKNRALYLLHAARNVMTVLGALSLLAEGYFLGKYLALRKFSNSEDFFDLASKSIDEAYVVLENTTFYIQMLKYFGLGIVCCVIAVVILVLVIKLIKRRNEKKANSTDDTMDEHKENV